MIGAKPGIEISQVQKTVDEQSRANEKDEGDCDFADDKQITKAISFFADGGITAAFFQRIVQIGVRRVRRWRESEYNSGQQGEQRRKHEHLSVNADRLCLRN